MTLEEEAWNAERRAGSSTPLTRVPLASGRIVRLFALVLLLVIGTASLWALSLALGPFPSLVVIVALLLVGLRLLGRQRELAAALRQTEGRLERLERTVAPAGETSPAPPNPSKQDSESARLPPPNP